jgi:hypothetical protein
MPEIIGTVTQIVGIITKLEHTMNIHREGGRHWWRRKSYAYKCPDITETARIEVTQKDGKVWTVTVQGCSQEFIAKCIKAYEGKWEATFTVTNDS